MRFIRQEYIITTICNKKLTDIDEIKTVLYHIKKDGIEFTVCINYMSHNGRYDYSSSHRNVKIKKVNETTVDFIIFNKSAITNLKEIQFNNIVEISAITKKNIILDYKNDVSRHELLDIEEDEDE